MPARDALAQPYDPPRQSFVNSPTSPPTTRLIPSPSAKSAMLYLVGLGLADEKDITVKGLEIVKKAERVYLEAYTAVLLVEKDVLVRVSD